MLFSIFGYTVTDMNIQTKKDELIQWLTSLTDVTVIDALMKLREHGVQAWWDELSDEEKRSIEEGIKDAGSGKLESHVEARKLYEKWL